MFKYILLCNEEYEVECNETTNYENFLSTIQEKLKLREKSFCVKELEECNFEEKILTQNSFEIERTEKDKALERLKGKEFFKDIITLQETEDFLFVYGFFEDSIGNTPLYWAASRGDYDIAKFILENDFDDVHRSNKFGQTPLYFAALFDKICILELILEKDFPNAHKADIEDYTPLFWAIKNNNIDMVKLILNKNFENANQADKDGITALHWAVNYGYKEIVENILEKNFDNAHQADKDGCTPIRTAINNNYIQIVELIKKDLAKRNKIRENI